MIIDRQVFWVLKIRIFLEQTVTYLAVNYKVKQNAALAPQTY